MSLKIKELIKMLKNKDQNAEVEFLVVKINGQLVCMDIEASAIDTVNILKLFPQGQ